VGVGVVRVRILGVGVRIPCGGFQREYSVPPPKPSNLAKKFFFKKKREKPIPPTEHDQIASIEFDKCPCRSGNVQYRQS
jgi:hypothetical protein